MLLLNEDCMDVMARYPDGYWELVIADPPYGINIASQSPLGSGCVKKKCGQSFEYTKKDWDSCIPDASYFKELFRVSKNQIIWGANYMTEHLPPSMGWIVWDKNNGTISFSDCELAYTSFDRALRQFTYTWHGMLQGDMKNKEQRIHPTQKPVKLYEWLLLNYAKEGDKILDTHLGSASSAIAAKKMGFDFVGCELDKEYFDKSQERIDNYFRQDSLF